jgi:hypothetical protein
MTVSRVITTDHTHRDAKICLDERREMTQDQECCDDVKITSYPITHHRATSRPAKPQLGGQGPGLNCGPRVRARPGQGQVRPGQARVRPGQARPGSGQGQGQGQARPGQGLVGRAIPSAQARQGQGWSHRPTRQAPRVHHQPSCQSTLLPAPGATGQGCQGQGQASQAARVRPGPGQPGQ